MNTKQGRYDFLDIVLRGESPPTNLYMALVTDANVPDVDTQTMSELTEIDDGNGYTEGGYQINRDDTDWSLDYETFDAVATLKDIIWTASGGTIPDTGDGASYAVLTTDEGTLGDRKVWAFWALSTERTAQDGQQIILEDAKPRIKEPA